MINKIQWKQSHASGCLARREEIWKYSSWVRDPAAPTETWSLEETRIGRDSEKEITFLAEKVHCYQLS